MSIEVELPALGESVVEGTLSKWLVREGETVAVDQPLVEVTTDKVDAEIPSPCAGVVEQILVAEGETVPVGEKLVRIAFENERAQTQESASGLADSKQTSETADGPVRATPLARRVAEQTGVELGGTRGTGAGGKITKSDVLREAQPETDRVMHLFLSLSC